MSAATGNPPPAILLAATLLLLRDSARGLEVFMVKRHHQIDFASGALVFPGGKAAPGDADPELRGLSDGVDHLSSDEVALRACAIREGFEESGILLARKNETFADPKVLISAGPWRAKLDKGEATLAAFARMFDLRLGMDALIPFARWITPSFMPKRFDTFFYLAKAPPDQIGQHDGGETVDSQWVTVDEAIGSPDRWTVIFPTRMNLLKLGRARTVEEALAFARADAIVTVEPKVITKDGRPFLTLPIEAGYGHVEEPLENIKR